MKLHPATGRNSYCGPTSISAITGCSTDDVSLIHRWITGKRSVKGMYHMELVPVMTWLGYAVDFEDTTYRTLLALGRNDRRRMIVNVTGHYTAICDGWCVDTVSPNGVELERLCRGKLSRVKRLLIPTKTHEPKPVPTRERLKRKHPHLFRRGNPKR